MAITEAARRNHEALCLSHESTLKVSDPELIEIFDNFAFDEAVGLSSLAARTRVMLTHVALLFGGAALAAIAPPGRRSLLHWWRSPAPASRSSPASQPWRSTLTSRSP